MSKETNFSKIGDTDEMKVSKKIEAIQKFVQRN